MVAYASRRAGTIKAAVRRLAARLAQLDDAPARERQQSRWLRASLRLQLADLRNQALGDPAAAADTLATALHELGPLPPIAEALFALQIRNARFGAARRLCREAARSAAHSGLRALWQRRLGDVCAADGDDAAAVRAYAAARADRPADPTTLLRCTAALGRLGRHDERARLLAERLTQASSDEELALHRELALLCAGPLSRPADAARHARRAAVLALACGRSTEDAGVQRSGDPATSVVPPGLPNRRRLCIDPVLGDTTHADLTDARDEKPGPERIREATARAAALEDELQALPGEDDLLDARRTVLHTTLAHLYADVLEAPDRALAHARAAFARSRSGDDREAEACAQHYLECLRSAHALLELDRVLADGEAGPPDAGDRLRSLARLRAGPLQDVIGAADAWRACLDGAPNDLEALRGLRAAACVLHDWPLAAWTLEEECALGRHDGGPADGVERARLLVELGEIARDGLGSTTRAARAFAAALEADPTARAALHALQGVLASMDDWKGVLELVLSELDLEKQRTPEMRGRLWVRAAQIAAELLDDAPHACESLRAARALGPLGADAEALARELGVIEAGTVPSEPKHTGQPEMEASEAMPERVDDPGVPHDPVCDSPSPSGDEEDEPPGPATLERTMKSARRSVARGAYAEARSQLERWIAGPEGPHGFGNGEACEGLAALLAGPFDAPAAAALKLDEAVARRPSDVRLRGRLADLLLRVPERHDEAIRRHRELLAHQPTRSRSIDALRALAALRGAVRVESDARATLSSLGIGLEGSTCERIVASIPIAHGLEQPVWERLRRCLLEARSVLARVLDTPDTSAGPLPGEVRARFREWALRAEGELASPALVPLDDTTLGVVVRLVVDIAFERESVIGEGRLVNRLASEFGWRSRGRLRRILAPFTAEEIADVDLTAWRRELRTLAHAEALARTGGDLRVALLTLTEEDGTLAMTAFGVPDLLESVRASPAASALLRRVCLAWSEAL